MATASKPVHDHYRASVSCQLGLQCGLFLCSPPSRPCSFSGEDAELEQPPPCCAARRSSTHARARCCPHALLRRTPLVSLLARVPRAVAPRGPARPVPCCSGRPRAAALVAGTPHVRPRAPGAPTPCGAPSPVALVARTPPLAGVPPHRTCCCSGRQRAGAPPPCCCPIARPPCSSARPRAPAPCCAPPRLMLARPSLVSLLVRELLLRAPLRRRAALRRPRR
ncbi:hypothetical protein BRADI_2g31515v3 [Brachypodium distachyon]|uniref:Uncharacterized protein n=1 Tax=Brachypodium distachyon TaxID=15368 RepID=A0A2K2DBC0_BRADI|nr:hypothetical protein BRADI_2g31515v3 [Brachypodium distachyon]